MNEKTRLLTDQARLLSPKERIELVEQVLATLDAPNEEIDRAWAEEAQDRLKAFRAGEIQARPFSEILTKYSKS